MSQRNHDIETAVRNRGVPIPLFLPDAAAVVVVVVLMRFLVTQRLGKTQQVSF